MVSPHSSFHVQYDLRERLNALYYHIFNPTMNRLILVVSLLLVVASFVDIRLLQAHWYHVLEGAVTFVFTTEIALRLYVMKSGFWESSLNIVEAFLCVFCVVVFSVLSLAHHTTRLEHNALVFLRYSAQFLRLVGVLHGSSSASVAHQTQINVFVGGHVRLDEKFSRAEVL